MVNNFKWHQLEKEEKEEIKKNAKNLLDEFSSKLEKIKVKDHHFSRDFGTREEGEPWKTDREFQDLMFLNAPFVEDNLLIAEKGSWK